VKAENNVNVLERYITAVETPVLTLAIEESRAKARSIDFSPYLLHRD
jgi:hypothetical protein